MKDTIMVLFLIIILVLIGVWSLSVAINDDDWIVSLFYGVIGGVCIIFAIVITVSGLKGGSKQ